MTRTSRRPAVKQAQRAAFVDATMTAMHAASRAHGEEPYDATRRRPDPKRIAEGRALLIEMDRNGTLGPYLREHFASAAKANQESERR